MGEGTLRDGKFDSPGGFYRRISTAEADERIASGEDVWWDEGVGYHVYTTRADALGSAAAPSSLSQELREALECIEVDLTAGDMPAKTRVTLALDRVRALLSRTKG